VTTTMNSSRKSELEELYRIRLPGSSSEEASLQLSAGAKPAAARRAELDRMYSGRMAKDLDDHSEASQDASEDKDAIAQNVRRAAALDARTGPAYLAWAKFRKECGLGEPNPDQVAEWRKNHLDDQDQEQEQKLAKLDDRSQIKQAAQEQQALLDATQERAAAMDKIGADEGDEDEALEQWKQLRKEAGLGEPSDEEVAEWKSKRQSDVDALAKCQSRATALSRFRRFAPMTIAFSSAAAVPIGEQQSVDGQRHKLFRKEILRTGAWQHPATGERITVTPALLKHLQQQFSKMTADGVAVPVPSTHTNDPDRNRGFVKLLERTKDKGGEEHLFAIVDLIGDGIGLAGRSDVSVCLEDVPDSHGGVYEFALSHLAAVVDPVVTHLSGWEAMPTAA